MNELMPITLYCVIDDFIKAVMDTETGQEMLESWKPRGGPDGSFA
jgi:hypothetical protein